MDNVPSQSISKPILIVTPLFLLVLAVLHSSSELSYLFILKFINNVAGSADITLMPTIQPEITHAAFNKQLIMNQYGMYSSLDYAIPKSVNIDSPESIQSLTDAFSGANIPLIDVNGQAKWLKSHPIARGLSGRWIVPTKIGNMDTILMVVDVEKEKQIGIVGQDVIPSLDSKQIAMEQMLTHKLGLELGDTVAINFKPKNILNGLKLFQKFQSQVSDDQYKPAGSSQLSRDTIHKMLYQFAQQFNDGKNQINQTQFDLLFDTVYDSEVNAQYTLKKSFYPEGIYASALTNVVVIEIDGFANLILNWIIRVIVRINENKINVQKYLPPEYRALWPKNQFQAKTFTPFSKGSISKYVKQYSLLAVCSLNSRQKIYAPHQGQLHSEFTKLLESTPGNVDVIVIYPFFKQSLAIKYFFDSVIQIFEFITCIIYFYTMTLIMKQIYEQKQVQVGIWRTLGAGAVSQRKQTKHEIEMNAQSLQCKGSGMKYSSQFQEKMSFKEKAKFQHRLAVKVGYIYYWIATILISIILYTVLKFILYKIICSKLQFTLPVQPWQNLPIMFVALFIFTQVLIYSHIQRILTNPLSETIKPVKRTFDVVKVRVIHVATFGISLEVLLIAIMLVYYGVVSYYWIPFSILDGQEDLQVLLFNTIFLFMIFGAIILLSIVQSKIQTLIFRVLFRFSSQMRCMKLAIIKNIKAKQYKNIKVSIIISIIFAFVLFFTAGIKIQMQIVQSFIERALGSNLVFENYQKNTFDRVKVQNYLNSKQDIQWAWLSKSLSRDNISISLNSHITGRRIRPQFQVLTAPYLNSTFFEYYYPQDYLPESSSYSKLPNSIHDGFNSIYRANESVGHFVADDTITEVDPHGIGIDNSNYDTGVIFGNHDKMAPDQQVIKIVVSSALRKQLGVSVGSFYKMKLQNLPNNKSYLIRAQVVHSFKAGPGFDLLGKKAFISEQQAAYIYNILGAKPGLSTQSEKLFIKGGPESLKGIGSSVVSMSPEHTQMFEIQFVSQSFSLLSRYLNMYIVLITIIMSTLVTVFIFLYTLGKCREESQMYKMLRAIGLSAHNIRVMVFSEIIIRIVVSIVGGVLLGIAFSIGFSLQIEEFLMIKTPRMDLTLVITIAIVLTLVLSATIIKATKYISERTVADTNKI